MTKPIPNSYVVDYAAEIDTEEEIIADQFGVSLAKARQIAKFRQDAQRGAEAIVLGRVIGLLLASRNLPVMVNALAMAAGLDQLNGAHSEAEVARSLGVTRSLLSHYVVGWRDILSGEACDFDVMKFRKRNDSRETYATKAKSPLLAAKERARHQLNKL